MAKKRKGILKTYELYSGILVQKRKKPRMHRTFGGKRFWLSTILPKKFNAQRYARLCRLDGHNARIMKVGKEWHVYESHARSKRWKRRYG